MRVNTRIYLPSDVRSLDVAKAVAILAGLPPRSTEHGFVVEGLELEPHGPGAAVEFILKGPMVDGATEHRFCLSFENSDYPGHDRGIYVLSTAFWVAIGRRLINLFGGVLLYTDCGGTEPDECNVRLWSYPNTSRKRASAGSWTWSRSGMVQRFKEEEKYCFRVGRVAYWPHDGIAAGRHKTFG